jgi:hypothetical protein
MVEWNNVQSSEDVSELMSAVERFHDWYLAGFSFDKPQVTHSTTEHDEIYAKLLDEHFAEKYPDLFAANK